VSEFQQGVKSIKDRSSGLSSVFASGVAASKKRGAPDDLTQRAAELEFLQQQTGAPEIPQQNPGVFRTLLDVLSRPNFAIAGFAEEILGEQPSVTRGVKRALTEIFSGVGGIQGEKRAFGETLERLGVGTKTLADAFPALEGTWVGAFGSRGAAGLALDIATDPLTYMTFGAASGGRIVTSKGIKFLNRAGRDQFNPLVSKHIKRLAPDGLDLTEDAIGSTRKYNQALKSAEEEFEALGLLTPEFLEPGGAKLFGKTIPGSEQVGGAIGASLRMIPESIRTPVVEGATKMREGMQRTVRGLFSKEGAFANLPEPFRARATRLTNDFFRSSTAHRSHLLGQMGKFERVYRKIAKKDPGIGERWHDIREKVIPNNLVGDELEAYTGTMAMYDKMGQTLVEHGIIKPEQFRTGVRVAGKDAPDYIFHRYKNIEDLGQYHPNKTGAGKPGAGNTITKERVFDTTREATEVSAQLHKQALELMSAGEARRHYPELIPEYDVFKNMQQYINKHSDVVARTAWREEMAAQFGKRLDEVIDPDAVYDAVEFGVKPKKTPGAPKDFSPENVPLRRVIQEGDVEPLLVDAFGPQGAQYTAVKSKLTSDEMVFMPRAIVDALENVNSKLFNTQEFRELGQLMKGFDWMNNNFKWGVYTIWPASATRDGYSNIALSMLRIGVAALDPRRHIDAVKLMAGRNLKEVFAGSGKTIGELREMAKTFGVWVPGRVFVEQTGSFKLGKARAALTEARAGIENEARVMLWLEEIRRGADPRLAADTVGEFLFNYGEVSKVERDIFRRMIPFYTFTRKNVELQWKMLRRNPGMQVNQLKPFRGRTDENEQMVQWEAEGLKMRMDRDGKTVHMLTGIDLPLRNLDVLWRGDLQRTGRSLMGMLTPMFKTIPEVLLNQDFFLGADLTRTQSSAIGHMVDKLGTPKPLKDWLGYKKELDEAGRPRYTFDGKKFTMLFRSWMLSRAISTSDRQFRDNMNGGGVEWQKMALDILTGIRAKSLNMDEQMQRKLRNRIRQLEESLRRRGVLASFEKTFAPKNPGELE
jgi:hypothetical protein